MSSFSLKIIAISTMAIDHIGYMLMHFFPDHPILNTIGILFRCIGRLAMPMFCFMIAEGFRRTQSKMRYMARVAIFAVIATVPYSLFYSHGELYVMSSDRNILWSFLFSIVGLTGYAHCKEKGHTVIAILAVFAGAALAKMMHGDYNIYAVAMVFVFYAFRENKKLLAALIILITIPETLVFLQYGPVYISQLLGPLALLMLFRYTGEQGKYKLKWFFYWFYPAHLLPLGLIFRAMYLAG